MGAKHVQPLWEKVWWFPTKMKVDLLQDSDTPLLDIDTRDVMSYLKDICSTMFITALFTIARN